MRNGENPLVTVTLANQQALNELHTIMKRTRNQYHYALRRCKRASEKIMKDKLVNSCINGKDNIFDKIQQMRRIKNKIPSTIDGNDNPEKRFKEVCTELYNSTNDKQEITETLVEIKRSITDKGIDSSMSEVARVTPDLISDVIKEVKSNKQDPIFEFNSNCIKKCPKKPLCTHFQYVKIFLSPWLRQ